MCCHLTMRQVNETKVCTIFSATDRTPFINLPLYLTFENSFCPKRIDSLFDKKCRLYAGQQWHVCIVLMVYDKTHNNTAELQMDIYNKMK